MKTPLRVLIVEDSPDDADLLVLQLNRAGYEPLAERVETAEAMVEALDRRVWDLVLSDYVMPRFSAPAALKVLQSKGLDLPFIIVSGAVGEELAAAAMKAGAHDYVRKDNLARLTVAIERELREAGERRERRRLEKEVLEISASEQRRIGQDLHDVLGQHLTGVAFMNKALQQKLAARSAPEAADAGEIGKKINEAISQTRALARGLCPVEPSAEGLMIALQNFAGSVEDVFDVRCSLKCDQPILVHDNATAVHLFHIAREAVNNAIRHGQAKNIEISLTAADGKTWMRVQDDGAGIAAVPPKDRGLGLNIMNYRARTVGGVLSVEALPAGGTAVTCALRNPQVKGLKTEQVSRAK